MSDQQRVDAVAVILRHTADLVDREDLPQTSEDTAIFCDGARWATAQVRQIAEQVTAEDPAWRPDGLTELAAGLVLNDPERSMLRYALELMDDRIASRPDEFPAVDRAAAESLRRLVGEGVQPEYTEDVEYQVAGDWGVGGANSAEEARDYVAMALRTWPSCGAYAEQRITRTWPDGSEFYGPWTPLTDEDRLAHGPHTVAYRSRVPGGDLRCLEHAPTHPERSLDWMALTSDDLEDGGICVVCGRDVLITNTDHGSEERHA